MFPHSIPTGERSMKLLIDHEGVNGQDFSQFLAALTSDVKRAADDLKRSDDQFHRRSYIRSVFSAIEGIIFLFKQLCLEGAARATYVEFTSGEIALLKEEIYSLQKNGTLSKQPRYMPIAENFRFSLAMYVRHFEDGIRRYKIPLDYSLTDGGWDALNQAVTIRNRITHPKRTKDLVVSQSEVSAVRKSFEWVYRSTMLHMCAGAELAIYLERETNELKKTLDHLRKTP